MSNTCIDAGMPRSYIELRVGNSYHTISRELIMRYPDSTIARKVKEREKQTELVFHRDSVCFYAIKEFYVSGQLHIPPSVCPNAFKEEMKYWGIEESHLALCCLLKYQAHHDDLKKVQTFEQSLAQVSQEEMPPWKVRLWVVLNNQSPCILNKVYNAIATTLIFTSVVLIAISMQMHDENGRISKNQTQQEEVVTEAPCPETKSDESVNDFLKYVCYTQCPSLGPKIPNNYNHSCPDLEDEAYNTHKMLYKICSKCDSVGMDNPGDSLQGHRPDLGKVFSSGQKAEALISFTNHSSEIDKLLSFENIFLVLYSGEFVLRIWSCPSKLHFVSSVLNWVDFLSISSSWVRFVTLLARIQMEITFTQIIFMIQILRIFRVFRSISHLDAFRILSFAVRCGIKDLLVIILYLVVGTIIFGSLIFTVEPHESYPNIGEAMWWSVITMTTVGYGDIYPTTTLGKVTACFCALYGLIMLALTIPIFTSTFQTIYRYTSCKSIKM